MRHLLLHFVILACGFSPRGRFNLILTRFRFACDPPAPCLPSLVAFCMSIFLLYRQIGLKFRLRRCRNLPAFFLLRNSRPLPPQRHRRRYHFGPPKIHSVHEGFHFL
jgi:hypothetical protein